MRGIGDGRFRTCLVIFVASLMVFTVLPAIGSPSPQGRIFSNQIPVLIPLSNKSADMAAPMAFSVTATDPDGDTLSYVWDFGDGSGLVVSSNTTHAYAKPGFYNFTVFVNDLTGLPGHNVSSSAQANITFPLTLAAAWNLVSVPVVGWGYKASTLPLAKGDVVIRCNELPYHVFIVGITDFKYDFPIRPGEAYWIWTAAAKTLHLYGTVPTTVQTINVTINSSGGGGWFAFGLASLKTWRAHDIAAMYSGPGRILMVAIYWPFPWGIYKTWLSGLPSLNDLSIHPGLGILIYVTETGGKLTYMP